jgi:hypothetical protein
LPLLFILVLTPATFSPHETGGELPYLAFKEAFRSLYSGLLLAGGAAAGDVPGPAAVRKRVMKSAANLRDILELMA